ncbi:SDR family NAD(P)-dependent oxidoreductase [Inquilinus limosus]|uniref:SDR family NAD(P)-dependent oxidoreductase n=1 Tax=Inquilinus limosus TaxID=171674 RepID=UPI001930BBE6|nr:SDR family NAD(P)-dependent oxidoreductase [Inquilinus limosus]
MTHLTGTVAVVTGAGRGIGREIALHQARAGAKVAILARTPHGIGQAGSTIARSGSNDAAVQIRPGPRRCPGPGVPGRGAGHSRSRPDRPMHRRPTPPIGWPGCRPRIWRGQCRVQVAVPTGA